ncbi:mannosyltransferase family protein [Frondihabitans cladoniiphilus]|uniref:Mannosyltransferase PIG-V n=1 Tax=Frondihabitans cladoniiphilus TaxID=715785 RepID=A0ABP8WDM9_9MICO
MLDRDPAIARVAFVEPARSPSRLLSAASRLPSWGAVLVIYGLSRVFSTVLLFVLYRVAATHPGQYADKYVDGGDTKGFFGFLNVWDGRFYTSIAEHGYPHVLPVDGSGTVVSNAWAFLPVYPWINRILAEITGWDTGAIAAGVATIFGALAAVMLHKFLRLRVDELSALWGTVFFCFGALAFVLEVGYAESLFFFLMFTGVWALMTKRYVLLGWVGVVASFTRPGALALALALLIVVIQRLRTHDDFPRKERIAAVVSGLAIAAAGLAWPLVAAGVTGDSGAYLKTEMSWWTAYIGHVSSFVPLSPWFLFGVKYLGLPGIIVVLAIPALWIWGMRKPSLKRLGFEIRAFLTAYALYLFAVFLPQQSLPRLIMPLAPLVAVDSITHHKHLRRLALVSSMAIQVAVAVTMWLVGPP